MATKKFLVVGAGLSGCTISRILADKGYTVDVIESRNHIGGNCYDYHDSNSILIHKYGPHLFHTSNVEVFNFLSRFTDWVDYKHKVKALLEDGRFVTFPINRETAEIVGKDKLKDVFIIPYTTKMWGTTNISSKILARVPVREDNNEFYFPDDVFQKLPVSGYTNMIWNMLQHSNITVKLETSFKKEMERDYSYIFNSMPIDQYFDYCFDALPYRSIKFHTLTVPMPRILPTVTVNFTHNGPYTRVTEWKLLPNSPVYEQNKFVTTLTIEEPCDYRDNEFKRFYPINDQEGRNQALYAKYKSIVPENMTFIGRCGMYRYFDMDDAVAEALKLVGDFLSCRNA